MGVPEDINWLKESNGRQKVFTYIALGRASKVRELKEALGHTDWWQVKQHVKQMMERGLVERHEGALSLTPSGQKLLEALKAVRYLEKV